MSFQIITDSCCDLTQAQYEAWNVACVPLTVTYNGKSHKNFSESVAVKAFYDELRNGVTATTSAANPEDWAREMAAALEAGRDVLVLCFSSALSGTCQSAVIAAGELREKYPQIGRAHV